MKQTFLLFLAILFFVGCEPTSDFQRFEQSLSATTSNDAEKRCQCTTLERAVITKDEDLVGEQDVPLTGLSCTARVMTVMKRSPEAEIRHLMEDPNGGYCDWQEAVMSDKNARSEQLQSRDEAEIDSLDGNWKGTAVVWLKHQPINSSIDEESGDRFEPEVVTDALTGFAARHPDKQFSSNADSTFVAFNDLTKADLLAIKSDPQVGRVVVDNRPPPEITEYCNECTGMSGWYFNLSPLTTATNYNYGFETGILEQYVYNCGTSSRWCPTLNGDPIDDWRVNDWTYSFQVAPCVGIGCLFNNYHENRVASRMWSYSAPLKNGNPISVGIGSPSFMHYSSALYFFYQKYAKVINRSIFDGVSWSECATADTPQYDLLQDYYSWSHGMLFVQAVSNICSDNPACIRLSNSITVGGETATMSQTQNASFYSGRLELPNVVGNCYATGTDCDDVGYYGFSIYTPEQPGSNMCAGGNSFNAPAVTAIASMIYKAAMSVYPFSSARWPETQRAIIMAGADYTPFQGIDTASWCAGCVGPYTLCQAVDCKYGAGMIDGGGAWDIYEAGDFQYWSGNPDPGWSTSTALFHCQQSSCDVKAALAWSNVVDCDTQDCSDDGHVIHNFDLYLEKRNGSYPFYWYTKVVSSTSSESTSEWLQYTITDQSYYRIRINLASRTVSRTTHFALAYKADGTNL